MDKESRISVTFENVESFLAKSEFEGERRVMRFQHANVIVKNSKIRTRITKKCTGKEKDKNKRKLERSLS